MNDTILYIVVPCYNEEEVLESSAKALKNKMQSLLQEGKISEKSRILFVNDGSSDRTWEIIEALFHEDSMFSGLCFSHNCGHQNAVLAGLLAAKDRADAAISIDADLQQDINAIDQMLDKYQNGCDVVYGIRNDRSSDGILKKITALSFYKLMHLLGTETIKNHADYRLMSRRAIEALSEYQESNLFLRGLIPSMGFKSDVVHFDVHERTAGKSKYTFSKMLSFAIDGITSFSVRPLRLITILGLIMLLLSAVMILTTLADYIFNRAVPGWTTIVCSIWLLGSIQLVSIGVAGEYIGKIYMEAKHRPRYHIQAHLYRDDTYDTTADDGKQ